MRKFRIGVVDQGTEKTAHYTDLVTRSGGEPVVLAWNADRDPDADAVEFDGLVLCGGDDLPGAYFGEDSHPSITLDDPRRDVYELTLCRRAVLARVPLLAICRGVQVLNVALGGSVEQHIPDTPGRQEHAGGVIHPLEIAPGSFLSNWLDWHRPDESAAAVDAAASRSPRPAAPPPAATSPASRQPDRRPVVNSYHHQAVGRVAPRLRATAWTDDGLVEAVETWDAALGAGTFSVGVQWHPERAGNTPALGPLLFEALLAAAGRGRQEISGDGPRVRTSKS